jgi:hypothetical protein
MPAYRLPSHAINVHDPLATPEENAIAQARAEARSGYFTGPGWAPTWHDRPDAGLQAFGEE